MQCPVDNTTLAMTDRFGIEIDYCPTCRGVWLGRGELDKIIERSRAQDAHFSIRDDFHKSYSSEKPKKKKGSFIGDLLGGFGED